MLYKIPFILIHFTLKKYIIFYKILHATKSVKNMRRAQFSSYGCPASAGHFKLKVILLGDSSLFV